MSEKVNKFLTTVGSVWGKRHDSEEAGLEWFKNWIFSLDRYEPWVLDAAARRIVDERRDDYFPKPAEVHQVCRQILAEDKHAKPTLSITPDVAHPYKLASELIQCELGRKAAREGCVLTLRDFVVRNARLPQGDSELKKLIQTRNDFQQSLIDCIDGNGGDFSGALAKLGRSMAKREYEIAQRVLGSDAEDWFATRL
jgi:hypothetical protein